MLETTAHVSSALCIFSQRERGGGVSGFFLIFFFYFYLIMTFLRVDSLKTKGMRSEGKRVFMSEVVQQKMSDNAGQREDACTDGSFSYSALYTYTDTEQKQTRNQTTELKHGHIKHDINWPQSNAWNYH